MHGRDGPNVPPDCRYDNDEGRIGAATRRSADWWQGSGLADLEDRRNTAIVTPGTRTTTDEKKGTQGCCGFDPTSPANSAAATRDLVITNHGPRGLTDDTV